MFNFSAFFICDFELALYPFDIQLCQVLLTLKENQLDNVRYIYKFYREILVLF